MHSAGVMPPPAAKQRGFMLIPACFYLSRHPLQTKCFLMDSVDTSPCQSSRTEESNRCTWINLRSLRTLPAVQSLASEWCIVLLRWSHFLSKDPCSFSFEEPLPVTSVSIYDYKPSPETGVLFEIRYPEKYNVFTRVNISYWEGKDYRTMLYKGKWETKVKQRGVIPCPHVALINICFICHWALCVDGRIDLDWIIPI